MNDEIDVGGYLFGLPSLHDFYDVKFDNPSTSSMHPFKISLVKVI